MVTSTKLPDKRVVKMAEQNTTTVVPQRTLLGEVNEHITCPLCRGYYIDATTIVECLHSFCRSCIIKHLQIKSYCPVCEMMINSAKPNIKLDKALQDIVYKLVPGLFQKEMERRQHFYASRPGPAASATPEQRGEDTERIIFSPEDVISFSLEYTDATDADSISSKSSDSNETQPSSATTRRFLQCPAIVNISHLKKFLSMKFDVDSTQFAIDILYKRVPLPDCYTLMDIAYIYNWKRNEPMRFFYQIIDYVAIRNRLFEANTKPSHFQDRKSSPTLTEDTVVSSPAINLNDQGSEASSGTDSPMPDDDNIKKRTDLKTNNHNAVHLCKDIPRVTNSDKDRKKNDKDETVPKSNDDVEKSQFLNSFELTAKSNNAQCKSSSALSNVDEDNTQNTDSCKSDNTKTDDTSKRKIMSPVSVPEVKKIKLELEKPKLPLLSSTLSTVLNTPSGKSQDASMKSKENEMNKSSLAPVKNNFSNQLPSTSSKDSKQQTTPTAVKSQVSESPALKRSISLPQSTSSPKRKSHQDYPSQSSATAAQAPKTVSPLKIQIPKPEPQGTGAKSADIQKPFVKKIPDFKPSGLNQSLTQKNQPVNKVRMDLLANNSDPTIDRSKILSQVNSSLHAANIGQTSGDPLKSLFDSCKINIPSSLSITLTDQKLDPRNTNESSTSGDQNKNLINKNLTGANSTTSHKVPSPPVHNYIEILKLPDTDTKKQQKTDSNVESKPNSTNKIETTLTQSKPNKSSKTSAKGPIPNLKPISDTKLAKQSGSYAAPITFQQTFEQQLQSLQSDKKSKVPKNKAQVPKLFPATHKVFTAPSSKTNTPVAKPPLIPMTNVENKTNTALDLSTPHNVQSQLDPQQTKAFETMQSIANLAKKQNLPSKGLLPTMSQSSYSNMSNRPISSPLRVPTMLPTMVQSSYSNMSNRPVSTPLRVPTMLPTMPQSSYSNMSYRPINTPLRVPSTNSQIKYDKGSSPVSQTGSLRQELSMKSSQIKQPPPNPSPTVPSPSYHNTSHNSPCTTQPSPRSQTRSPSSSPKLVIAEDKQSNGPPT